MIKKIKFSWLLFVFSLVFFIVIFYLVRHFMFNLDELDNILAPFLMAQGKKFYLDTFNMHFPLPYYFSYIFSPFWVNQNPSRAIAIFRLSLVFAYFLPFFLTFISYKNKKSQISISLWIIFLSILAPLYHGNLYLSETFTAIFISSIFWLITPVLLKWEKFSNYHTYLIIIFASLAFWTQPMMILLFLIPFLFNSKSSFFKIFIITFLINSIPILLFLINGQLLSFIKQSIIFNFQTYSHFFPEQINNYSMFQQNILSFIKNEYLLLTKFNTFLSAFQFLSQLSLIVFFLVIIFQKKLNYLAFISLIFISINLRSIKIIPNSIFNFAIFPLLCISSASIFILFFYFKNIKIKSIYLFLIILIFISNLLSFSPILKQSLNNNYNYDAFWSYRQRIGEYIDKFTLPDEKILIYPHDSDLYFFAKRQPIDIFPYWYPWINENTEFKNQRLQVLQNNPPALIYVGNFGYKNNPNAYREYFPNLLENYINIKKDGKDSNFYLRSDLKDRLKP